MQQGIPHQETLERTQTEQHQVATGRPPAGRQYETAAATRRASTLDPPRQLKSGMESFLSSTVLGLAAVVGLWHWLKGDGQESEGGGDRMPQSTGTTVIACFDDIESLRAAVADLTAGTGFTRDDIDVVPAGDDAVRVARAHDLDDYEAGFLLGVRALGSLDQKAIVVLSRHNPVSVIRRPFSWQEQGLEGFELEPSREEVGAIQKAREFYVEKLGEQYDNAAEK